MATLYEIAGRLRNVIERGYDFDPDTGEILFDASDLDALEMDLRDKVEGTALYIKEQEALAKAIKGEEDVLRARRDAIARKVERLKGYLLRNMPGLDGGLETPRVQVRTRRSTVVGVEDERLVPDEYMTTRVTSSVDMRAVRLAIKSGMSIPGCSLYERESVVIK